MRRRDTYPWSSGRTTAVAILFGLLVSVPAWADVPEAYRTMWDDPDVVARIDRDTEQYRKADAVIEVVDANGVPVRGAKITARQKTHEFLFGCNLFVLGQLETPALNTKYEKAFTHLFNFATVPFYWGDLEPQQGRPRYAEGASYIWRRPPPDRLVKWCKAHEITPKGHALLYAKNMFMPEWTIRNDPQAFMKQARQHIAELAERYGGEIAIWDVINEEIPRVDHLDQWHAVPADYSVQAFREADRLFPKEVKLLINDGTSQTHVTTDKCEANVKKLLDAGVRVDGIGIQCHVYGHPLKSSRSYSPKQMIAVYDRLGQLGLNLYITEITVPCTAENGPALQAVAVANLYRLWFSTPKMAGITWWNLGDGTAFGGENKALGGLLDKDLDPKPSYEALDRLINQEWKTQTSGTTDADGRFAFRGFKGGYQLRVGSPGKTQEFSVQVASDSKMPHKLVFGGRVN